MPSESISELALIEANPSLRSNPKASRVAIRRCMAAWNRAYDAFMEKRKGNNIDKMFATAQAGPAYCQAMPPLDDYESIRSFIACVAHGILIEAIPPEEGEPASIRCSDRARRPPFRAKSAKIRLTPTPLFCFDSFLEFRTQVSVNKSTCCKFYPLTDQ